MLRSSSIDSFEQPNRLLVVLSSRVLSEGRRADRIGRRDTGVNVERRHRIRNLFVVGKLSSVVRDL